LEHKAADLEKKHRLCFWQATTTAAPLPKQGSNRDESTIAKIAKIDSLIPQLIITELQ
jgi:hypothetical protein